MFLHEFQNLLITLKRLQNFWAEVGRVNDFEVKVDLVTLALLGSPLQQLLVELFCRYLVPLVFDQAVEQVVELGRDGLEPHDVVRRRIQKLALWGPHFCR